MYYGQRSLGEFLLHSGFLPDASIHEYILVRFGLAKADPLSADKASALSRLELPRYLLFIIILMQI